MGKRLEERMITHLTGISNGQVLVVYDITMKCIVVQNQRTNDEYRCFDGPGDVKDLYESFKAEFSESIDYQTALIYFGTDLTKHT